MTAVEAYLVQQILSAVRGELKFSLEAELGHLLWRKMDSKWMKRYSYSFWGMSLQPPEGSLPCFFFKYILKS